MKFLLINPFVDYSELKEIFVIEAQNPPLGLLYIASTLEKEGHIVEIFDFCAEKFTQEKLINALNGVDVVGVTVRSTERRSAELIIKLIKKKQPQIITVIGGPHCTIDPLRALNDTKADICVEGDGEIAIIKIAQALQKKANLSEIPGIFYFENHQIKHGPPAEIIEDLDAIPFPARHLIEKYKYGIVQDGLEISRGKTTMMMVSRGCPYKCKFCVSKVIAKKYRTRSVENVIDEIKEIEKEYDFLFILDDNFFVDLKNATEILDKIIAEKINLEFAIAGVRVDVVTRDLLKKMRKAGVTLIAFGLESGNQDVLDFYNKGTNLKQIRNAVYLARKEGFITSGSFIFGAPIETEKHFRNTIEFAKKLKLDMAVFAPLGYYKGSPLWNEAVFQGKIKDDEYFVVSDSSRDLGNFSSEYLWNLVISSFKEYYLRPGYIFRQLFLSITRRDARMIKSGIKMLLGEKNMLKYKIT